MDLLYVHGGPGLNSEPDRRLLSDFLRESGLACEFWNEPSALRPDGRPFTKKNAYTNWLSALEESLLSVKPKTVVAASFGALGVMDLLNRNPAITLRRLVMIAPTLDLNRVFRKMMEFSLKDLDGVNPEAHQRLRDCLSGTSRFWDSSMQAGLALVWQNPHLLDHYFRDSKLKESWAKVMADPGYQVDFESQNAVLDEIAMLGIFKPFARKLSVPLTVLYGSHDPVFDRSEVEGIIQERFHEHEYLEFKGCAHFPHLENREAFVKMINEKLK